MCGYNNTIITNINDILENKVRLCGTVHLRGLGVLNLKMVKIDFDVVLVPDAFPESKILFVAAVQHAISMGYITYGNSQIWEIYNYLMRTNINFNFLKIVNFGAEYVSWQLFSLGAFNQSWPFRIWDCVLNFDLLTIEYFFLILAFKKRIIVSI